ncbi:GIY-YIG nuclease family protein [Pedobacter sp. SL55]|uniref:GIY-YIG nuclease family protein n=1 Tax=Pedobacter sp. SL55 TaxID=2995161 RepID=UPI00227039C0|nr:GIY-YIG nuclease family protein [Pedobacter sp. SL55]WAC41945.1 GIY-YIG nuclease family protein [Pedobacter sp. SL55]
MQRGGLVYILTNKSNKVLYVGVTSDIAHRIWQHKNHIYPNSFTAKYNCEKLVYYCFYPTIEEAIFEEKRIKGGSRLAKITLIKGINPHWKDLYDEINF